MKEYSKEEFEKILKEYDDSYYNDDISKISEDQYIEIKNKYIELYGEYNYVPGKANEDAKKYKHTTNVSSLGKIKINEQDKIRKKLEELWPVLIQKKYDGLTLVIYPDEDVTRGNGKIGEIVTEKTKNIEGMGKRLKYPIRGEILITHEQFNKLNEERYSQGLDLFQNCRNAAAGILRRNDINEVKGLKIFAYNILKENVEDNDNKKQLELLKANGWNTADYYEPKDIDDAINYINTFDRTELDYDIDGLVIKHNGNKTFGSTEHHPNSAIAIKFISESSWTNINRIEYTIGRTGKLTPIAILEPIEISGSVITKATLNNYNFMKVLGLTKICFDKDNKSLTKVKVAKSNDVIPEIIDIEQPKEYNSEIEYNELEKCPECGELLIKENSLQYCRNKECTSITLNKLSHLARKDAFNIENLSYETSKKLIAKGKLLNLNIHHPSFIYELSYDDILSLEGFADKSAKTLYDNIQKSKDIYFDRFLFGCSIPLIGSKAARDIAEAYYDKDKINNEVIAFSNDYNNNFKTLEKVNGIGPKMIKSLIANYNMIIPFGDYDFTFKDIIPKKKNNKQLNIVITGKFEIPRNDIKKLIEESGNKVSSSVSNKTDYLLASINEKNTTKYKSAIKLNVNIINDLSKLKEIINLNKE